MDHVATHASAKGMSSTINLLYLSVVVVIYFFSTHSIFMLFCYSCYNRVIRAFLIEEQKIVKKVLAEKSKKSKKSE